VLLSKLPMEVGLRLFTNFAQQHFAPVPAERPPRLYTKKTIMIIPMTAVSMTVGSHKLSIENLVCPMAAGRTGPGPIGPTVGIVVGIGVTLRACGTVVVARGVFGACVVVVAVVGLGVVVVAGVVVADGVVVARVVVSGVVVSVVVVAGEVVVVAGSVVVVVVGVDVVVVVVIAVVVTAVGVVGGAVVV